MQREKEGNQDVLAQESTLPNNQKKKERNYPDIKQNKGYIFKRRNKGFNEHISHSNSQMHQGYAVFRCPYPRNLCFPDSRAWHLVWLADPAGVPRNQSQRGSYCHSLLAW